MLKQIYGKAFGVVGLALFWFATLGGHGAYAANGAPRVSAVYPSADQLPANILRFYIRFTEPMQEIGILRFVSLKDEAGNDLSAVFFDNQYELWNQDRTTVTLLLDPGRVKTGLAAHQSLGRAFQVGQKYSLHIKPGLKNFSDEEIKTPFVHHFTATTPDTTAPKPASWELKVPKVGSSDALEIGFNEPIDHISALTLIRVAHNKKPIDGKVSLDKHETVWKLQPSQKWRAGSYEVQVQKTLEDVAANSVLQVFDQPKEEYKSIAPILTIPFQLK